MNSIARIRDCYGCGVCSVICPRQIVEIKHNKKGFYQPCMDKKDQCTDCGLCLSVCAFAGVAGRNAPVEDNFVFCLDGLVLLRRSFHADVEKIFKGSGKIHRIVPPAQP